MTKPKAKPSSEVAELRAEMKRLRARLDTLTDRLLDAHAPAQSVVMQSPAHDLPEAPKRERSVIDAVIRLEAKGNQGLIRYMRDRSRTLKTDHPQWTDQQIATELSRWETAEEMAPEFLVGATGLTPNEQVS